MIVSAYRADVSETFMRYGSYTPSHVILTISKYIRSVIIHYRAMRYGSYTSSHVILTISKYTRSVIIHYRAKDISLYLITRFFGMSYLGVV